jgi:Ni/Fe-hydrogenase subunit HybB-like protein
VTKPPDWHALVAWDVLFNGLATGLYMVAVICTLFDPTVFAPLAPVAFPLALAILVVDLVLLVLDLGDPWRFHHMLRVFKPTSPMSMGVWALSVFGFFAAAAAVLSLIPGDGTALTWSRGVVLVIGLVPALASAMYKGVLFSTTSQPVWRDGRGLGAYLTTSASVLGGAVLLLLATLLGREEATAILRPALALLLALSLIPFGLLLVETRPGLACVSTPGVRRGVGSVVLAAGFAVPLLLLLLTTGAVLMATAVVFLLAGNLASRYAIVYIPHTLRGPMSN